MESFTNARQAKNATVAGTALGISSWSFTAATLALCSRAIISAANADVRFTYDGTLAPTATVGHFLAKDSNIELQGAENINNLQMIRTGGTSAVVTITIESDQVA